jgi:hypothetical protein
LSLRIKDLTIEVKKELDELRKDRSMAAFQLKEFELEVNFAVEKRGEGGFQAFVVSAGAGIGSQEVQRIKLKFSPISDTFLGKLHGQ